MDREISWPARVYSCFRTSPPIFGTDLLRYDELDPARSALLADFCTRHSLHFRTFRLVRAKSDLAVPQATDSHCFPFIPCLSGLQPALGGIHAYQPGMDPIYLLSTFFRFYSTCSASTLRAERSCWSRRFASRPRRRRSA